MKTSKTEKLLSLGYHARKLGLMPWEVLKLLRIEAKLRRWFTEECNGTIQRDGDDGEGKPFWVFRFDGPGEITRSPIRDGEASAKRQLAKIMAEHPKLVATIQGDPRGAVLEIQRKGDKGRGLVVCVV